MFLIIDCLSFKIEAARIGSVAFFEPEIEIEPDNNFFSFNKQFLHEKLF